MNMDLPECKGFTMVSVKMTKGGVDVLASYGLLRDSDGFIGWERNSEEHPRNWTTRRKIYDTVLIILLEFYTYVSWTQNDPRLLLN